MITKFKIYENEEYEIPFKVGDYVYVDANDDVSYGPGEVPVHGDAGKILKIDPNDDPEAPGGYTATVKLLSQDYKVVTLYDYELQKKIKREVAKKMKYHFNDGDIVKRNSDENKYYLIEGRKFDDEPNEFTEKYYLTDAINRPKNPFQGEWISIEDIRSITDEEQEDYKMIKFGKKYNL